MPDSYRLEFSPKALPIEKNVAIYPINANTTGNPTQFYIFGNNIATKYEFDRNLTSWQSKWRKSMETENPAQNRIIHFPTFQNTDNIFILKTSQGINFYQLQSNDFKLLSKSHDYTENEFHDAYNWNEGNNVIKTGHLYQNHTVIGIVTNHEYEGIQFYVLNREALSSNQYPMWRVVLDLNPFVNYSSPVDIFLSDIQGKGQQNIIVRNKHGLNIFEFDEDYEIESIMEIADAAKFDDTQQPLFFPNLTGRSFRDIVIFNKTGMFIYQYNKDQRNYLTLHYNPLFSEDRGWTKDLQKSILFEDIDSDGFQEMIFTGPHGMDILSFDRDINQWISHLDNRQLPIAQRYSEIMAIIPANPPIMNNSMIFTHYSNQLHWANAIPVDTSAHSLSENVSPADQQNSSAIFNSSLISLAALIPQIVQTPNAGEKPVRLLRDQLDCSFMMNSLDKYTGKISFQLPLADLSSIFTDDIKLDLIYNGISQESNILGVGWSLPQNFITMDHQSSVYQESEKYFLVVDNTPIQLLMNPNNSTETIYSFDISNDAKSETQILYYKNEEKWEIKGSNTTQIYGGTGHASTQEPIIWEIVWKNWRGLGTSSADQSKIATSWYLAEVRNKNNVMKLAYDSINTSIPGGNEFTRGIYLKNISSLKNEIIFKYSAKNTDEFKDPEVVDKNGFIKQQLVASRYLNGYTLSTPEYHQNINFIYNITNGKRLLTEMRQNDDPTAQPILQFAYKSISETYHLEAATLPSGTRIEFQYKFIGQASSVDKQLGDVRLDVPSDHKVNFVNGEVVVSYIDNGNIILQTFEKNIAEDRTISTINTKLGRGLATYYEIIPAEDYFAIIIHYGSTKELNLLDKTWKKTAEFTFDENTVIKFGNDFMVTSEKNSFIYIIQWSNDLKTWQKKVFETNFPSISAHPSLVTVFDNTFVVYNNNIFWIAFKDCQQKWHSKKIKEMNGGMDSVKTTLDKFQLSKEKTERLLNFFQLYALQMYKNLFLLSRWNLEGGKLYTILDLFVLNSKYEIAKSQQFKVAQENLLELELDNGDLKFVYELSDGKFKVVIRDIKGRTLDDILKRVEEPKKTINYYWGKSPDHNELKRKAVEDTKEHWIAELEKSSEKDLLFNPWKHVTVLNSQTATCGNKTFMFNGVEWHDQLSQKTSKSEQNSLQIGDKLQLVQKSKDVEIKLYKGTNEQLLGTSLVNLGITNFHDIFNAYPVYLAYHDKSIPSPRVIEFSNNGDFEKVTSLSYSEKLSPFSDYQMLVSSIPNNSASQKNTTLLFRQMFGLNKFSPNPVVSKVSYFLNSNDTRSTGFEYKSPKLQNTVIYYEELSIIPGNDRDSFGWIKEERFFNESSQAKRKYFNGHGNLIKVQVLEEQHDEVDNNTIVQQEDLYVNSTFFDKSGQFKVAEFFNNDISDEEIGYYGFEEYEKNQIGLKSLGKKWIFEESQVVKNGFSFTGQNYLKLSQNTFHGTFQPKNQDQDYIASCWVRPHNEIIDDTLIAPFIIANIALEYNDEVYEYTRMGQVKYQFDDWYYVEVLINFSSVKDVPKYNNNSTTPVIIAQNLKTSILISVPENSTIDIDHIRFSPLSSPFKCTVYDKSKMLVKEEIQHDGLVKRYIYDKTNKEIASIDENGYLKEIKTYTKASSIGRIHELNSIVQIQPETGFYEKFAPFSFQKRWNIDTIEAWQISPNQLTHLTSNENYLSLNMLEMDPNSYGMRFYLTLGSRNSFLKFGSSITFKSLGVSAEFTFLGKKLPIPSSLEIVITIENARLLIWIDGGLYFDEYSNNPSINIMKSSGNVTLTDMIVFNRPNIQTFYYNSLQEKVQEIKMENDTSAIVKEYLYDELGRQAITTQSARVIRSNHQPLLSYHATFVTNRNPYLVDSVWKTSQLTGELKDIAGEYGYSQIKYSNNPLNEKIAEGLPGKEFSISGPYSKRFSASCSNGYIGNVYPISMNYTHQVEYKPGNVKHVTVFDHKKNKVAKYIDIPNFKDILSTYEYDSKGNVITILSPLYHEKAKTLGITLFTPNITIDYSLLKRSLGIVINYDNDGNIISRETPDAQKVEHIYDNGLLKFTITYTPNHELENVIYFDYDDFDRLYETGELTGQFLKPQLTNLTLTSNNTRVYQQFSYNDLESEPILRKKMRRSITFNEGNPIMEEFTFNNDQETTIKQIFIPSESNEIPQITEIKKTYKFGKVMMIEYPTVFQNEMFKLIYKYNKLGQIISIGVPGHENFVDFLYNAGGQVQSELYMPNTNMELIRQYVYNSAGFLSHIKDEFLEEDISYTENSYGGYGYGDGTITATKFEAKWHEQCNNKNLQLHKDSFISSVMTPYESELCFNKLKEAEYFDSNNRQAKVFYPKLNQELPLICAYGVGSHHIQKILGKKGFPSHYGHSYDYGNHQELIKAKYFIGKKIPLPLQPDTFSKEIPTFNSTTSRDIWQILCKSGYIIQHNEKSDFAFGHGKQAKNIIRSNMFDDLGNISVNYRMYEHPLQRIIVSCLAKKQKPAQIKSVIQNAVSKWIYYKNETDIKEISINILNMLEKNSYLINPFTHEFNTILKKYQPHIPEIVCVLQDHFGSQLGEAEFDVESYDIDANGNHKLFYTGFDRYQLEYKDNTNQINNLIYQSFSSIEGNKNFKMKHDNRGNVIQALHKGIHNIQYDSVSNRPIKIELVDGRSLLYHYDMQGERILKRLVNKNEETIYEVHYFRDESGKPLVEKKFTFISSNLPPDVMITTYVYGPRGLLGFLRGDEFYSIFSDHEGSIRLVIRGDEVVAAYDYLPYGDTMRKFENNPESQISYLYTGQELDAETGLYNFHARFYDPSIGRFYQIDPREQYFNPYKYAGNSPVSMIDPNGEFAFLIPLGLAVIGAYLGGASANNNANPFEWELDKASTWLGIVGGGVGGGLMAMGFAGSVGFFTTTLSLTTTQATALTIGLGLGASYINMAAVNGKINPAEWSFTPATFNAAFQGFGLGSGFGGGIHNARQVYSQLSSKLAKGVYLTGIGATGAGIFTVNGFASDWDFKNPQMWAGLLDAFTMAPDLPILLRQGHLFFKFHGNTLLKSLKYGKSYKKLDSLYENSKKIETIFSTLKRIPDNPRSVLDLISSDIWKNTAAKYPAAFSAFAMTLGVGSITGTGYAIYAEAKENGGDINSIYLYHSMINGMVAVGQLSLSHKSPKFKKTVNKKIYTPLHEDTNSLKIQISHDGKYLNWDEGLDWLKISLHSDHNLHKSSGEFKHGPREVEGGEKSNARKLNAEESKTKKDPQKQDQEGDQVMNKCFGARHTRSVRQIRSILNSVMKNKKVHSNHKTDGKNKKDKKKLSKYGVTNLQKPKLSSDTIFSGNGPVSKLNSIPEMPLELVHRIETIVSDTMKRYAEELRKFSMQNSDQKSKNYEYYKTYEESVRTLLEKGKIPNKVITVIISKKEAFVGFSNNRGPGMVSYYYNEARDYVFLRDNLKVGKVKADNQPEGNQFLRETQDTVKALVSDSKRIFESKMKEMRTNIQQAVAHRETDVTSIESKQFARYIVKKFKDHIWTELQDITKLKKFGESQRLEKLHDFMLDYSSEHGKPHIMQLETTLRQSTLIKEISNMVNAISSAPFLPWSPQNCGEPHALTALKNKEKLFRKDLLRKPRFSSKNVKSQTRSTEDISYMAAFEVPKMNFLKDLPETMKLKSKERCIQCKYTSFGVNVLTDGKNEWSLPRRIKFPEEVDSTKIDNPPHQQSEERKKRSVFGEFIKNHKNSISFSQEINQHKADNVLYIDEKNAIEYNDPDTSSSWMNWFTWLKNYTNGFFDFTHELEIPHKTSSDSTISQSGTQFDTNGTILLLDLLVRKVTGKKFSQLKDSDKLSLLEIQGDAISIVTEFEDLLDEVAIKLGIPSKNLTFDPIKIQEIIIDQLKNGQFSKISETLNLYAIKANPEFEHDAVFLTNLKHHLEKSFDTEKSTQQTSVQKKLFKNKFPTKHEASDRTFINFFNPMTQDNLNKTNILLIN